MAENNNYTDFAWLIPISEIGAGKSAILGQNYIAFYIIHCIAILIILISMTSSAIVIYQIANNWRKPKSKLDFTLRFPLYMAIAELLWGFSHLIDHMYLVVTKTIPEKEWIKLALSINLWLFFGYQQMLHASVALYIYIKVVKSITLDLGRNEWKLHLLCFSFLVIVIIIFTSIGAFGYSGYWFLQDATTNEGSILGYAVAGTGTFNAVVTTSSYFLYRKYFKKFNFFTLRIKQRVNEQKEVLKNNHNPGYHSTVTRCLTTYIWVAACLYTPAAFLYWICVIENYMGYIEPITCFLIIVTSNSSGWANAYGFFYNERIKDRRREHKFQALEKSGYSNSSNTYH